MLNEWRSTTTNDKTADKERTEACIMATNVKLNSLLASVATCSNTNNDVKYCQKDVMDLLDFSTRTNTGKSQVRIINLKGCFVFFVDKCDSVIRGNINPVNSYR